MKKPLWKSRPMTVWEKVGATFVAAVVIAVLFRALHYLISTIRWHSP